MASGKTTNLELNQWAKTDPVRMEEFNADNRKIDEAMSGVPKIVTGEYSGIGTYGINAKNRLTFDFPAKLLLVRQYNEGCAPAMLYRDETYARSNGYDLQVTWDSDGKGVSWYCTSGAYQQMNSGDVRYLYIVFG